MTDDERQSISIDKSRSPEELEAALRLAVANTERQVAEIEKSRRVSQEIMQISFCNCKDGRCGRGSR